MAESFNSPAHAIAFLKRRGLFNMALESSIHVMYIDLTRHVTDPHDIEACRYLRAKDHWITYQRNIYRP